MTLVSRPPPRFARVRCTDISRRLSRPPPRFASHLPRQPVSGRDGSPNRPPYSYARHSSASPFPSSTRERTCPKSCALPSPPQIAAPGHPFTPKPMASRRNTWLVLKGGNHPHATVALQHPRRRPAHAHKPPANHEGLCYTTQRHTSKGGRPNANQNRHQPAPFTQQKKNHE